MKASSGRSTIRDQNLDHLFLFLSLEGHSWAQHSDSQLRLLGLLEHPLLLLELDCLLEQPAQLAVAPAAVVVGPFGPSH